MHVPRARRARATAIASLLLAVLVAGLAMPAIASARRPADRIVFAANRGGTFDLYSVNADGSDLRLVLGGPMDEYEADVSPDGKSIVFVRAVGLNCCGPASDIYIAKIDGTGVRLLTPADPAVDDYRPQWSPDGKTIAFSRGTNGGSPSNIYTVRPDGSGLDQLTHESASANNFPAWAPDGSELAFVSSRRGSTEIWIMDADGSHQRAITAKPAGFSPQWSPTGHRIVFRSGRDGGMADELYTVRSDGTGLARLTTDSHAAIAPTWSPDGRRIAFVSLRDIACISPQCPTQLWVMDADGTDARRITDPPLTAAFPDYSPRAR